MQEVRAEGLDQLLDRLQDSLEVFRDARSKALNAAGRELLAAVRARIGGSGATSGFLSRRRYVKTAPIKVARLPHRMSGRIAPPKIFPIRQPINRPGTAAGVNKGRMVRASARRTCTSPKEKGAKTYVSTT